MAMKYIIVDGMYLAPFLFNAALDHSEFAHMVTHGRPEKVTSAGSVEIVNGKVECYGQSTSLKLTSKEGDSELVTRFLSS